MLIPGWACTPAVVVGWVRMQIVTRVDYLTNKTLTLIMGGGLNFRTIQALMSNWRSRIGNRFKVQQRMNDLVDRGCGKNCGWILERVNANDQAKRQRNMVWFEWWMNRESCILSSASFRYFSTWLRVTVVIFLFPCLVYRKWLLALSVMPSAVSLTSFVPYIQDILLLSLIHVVHCIVLSIAACSIFVCFLWADFSLVGHVLYCGCGVRTI